jgi:hypothetical protein
MHWAQPDSALIYKANVIRKSRKIGQSFSGKIQGTAYSERKKRLVLTANTLKTIQVQQQKEVSS